MPQDLFHALARNKCRTEPQRTQRRFRGINQLT